MKVRWSFVVLIAVVAAAASYFFLFDSFNELAFHKYNPARRNAAEANQHVLDVRAKVANKKLSEHVRSLTPSQIRQLNSFGKKLEDFARDENRPIRFTGKVIDQNGVPVSDVEIDYAIVHIPMLPTYGHWTENQRFSTKTDSAGGFSIQGKNGVILEITQMNKPGYMFESQQLPDAIRGQSENTGHYTFNFSVRPKEYMQTLSSIDDPYIVHAWKIHTAGQVIRGIVPGDWGANIPGKIYPADGVFRSISIPELDGKIDVAFTARYDNPSSTSATTWDVHIRGDGVKFAESRDVFAYEAPIRGYNSEWSQQYKWSGEIWASHGHGEVPKTLYINYDDGKKYGRLDMTFRVYDSRSKSVLAKTSYILNNTGSRNLQPKLPQH